MQSNGVVPRVLHTRMSKWIFEMSRPKSSIVCSGLPSENHVTLFFSSVMFSVMGLVCNFTVGVTVWLFQVGRFRAHWAFRIWVWCDCECFPAAFLEHAFLDSTADVLFNLLMDGLVNDILCRVCLSSSRYAMNWASSFNSLVQCVTMSRGVVRPVWLNFSTEIDSLSRMSSVSSRDRVMCYRV